MKTIVLKTWENVTSGIDEKDIPKQITSQYLIRSVMVTRPEQGFDIEKMRLHIKVLDKLDSLTGMKPLLLEDAEYNALKQAAVSFKWGFAHKCFVEFVDSIDQAKEVK